MKSGSCLVVYCAHGLGDPLVAPLMLDYVLRLQHDALENDLERQVLFFTEEAPNATTPLGMEIQLQKAHVQWLPLRYDVKGNQWLQKLRIVRRMYTETRSFVRPYGDRWLLGYLSYGGAYAVLAQMLGLGRSMVLCFEPHSRYMVEMGIWGRRSVKAIFMRWLERLQMRRSEAIIVPTRAGDELVRSVRTRAKIEVQGITIDVGSNLFDAAARASYRKEHSLEGTTVVVYVGKFGGIYYSVEEYMRFVGSVAARDPKVRFLVIAQSADLDAVRGSSSYGEFRDRMLLQGPVPPADLHGYLSAADFGVIAVPPTPSQAFRTPVKTALYWAAGLPVIVPRGVSDDHLIAVRERVGIVVGGLPDLDLEFFMSELDAIRAEDPLVVRARCMNAAFAHRDSSRMLAVMKRLLVCA